MAIGHGQITITTSATLIIGGDEDGAHVVISNGGGTIFIGDANVTVNNGCRVLQNVMLSLTVGPNEAIYGVCSSGTTPVSYIASMNL